MITRYHIDLLMDDSVRGDILRTMLPVCQDFVRCVRAYEKADGLEAKIKTRQAVVDVWLRANQLAIAHPCTSRIRKRIDVWLSNNEISK